MNAGAKLNFGKAEVYWPQDDAASNKYQELLGLIADPSAQEKSLIEPTFDAKVRIDAQIDVLVTPEVSFRPSHIPYPALLPRVILIVTISGWNFFTKQTRRRIWV